MFEKTKKRMVIGLGTGRSGTSSLARFLDAQHDSYFVHESAYNQKSLLRYTAGKYLPWDTDGVRFNEWYQGLFQASGNTTYFGDVCASLLTYVPIILEREPSARFVCIKRNKKDTVDSFLAMTSGINYWDENNTFKEVDFWGRMFPTIAATSKREAIEKYWDLYYSTAEKLQIQYPNSIRIFAIESLNSKEGRQEILDFIGYPEGNRKLDGDFHVNKRIHRYIIFLCRIYMIVYARILRIHRPTA